MIIYYGELIGTCMYIFIGLSIVFATVFEKESIGKKVVISLGWALSYFLPSIAFGEVSGPHLNPMITISLVTIKKFERRFMWGYMIMQIAGSILGLLLFNIINRDKLKKINKSQAMEIYSMIDEGIVKTIINEFLASFFTVFSILSIAQVFGISVEIIYIYVIAIMFVVGLVFDYRVVSTNPIRFICPHTFFMLFYEIKQTKNQKGKKRSKKNNIAINYLIHIVIPIISAVLGAMAYNYLPWSSAMLHQ